MIDPRDEGEIAQDYQDKHNQDAIDRVLARARRPTGPSAESCEECGEEIPLKRREAERGCTLCIECKRLDERIKGGM